jgi:Na+/H+-dicarboxylate symporter
MKLWHKVTIGLMLGVLFGYYFPLVAIKLKFIGEIFNRAIKLVIAPLVFCALVNGLLSANGKSLNRLGLKATCAFVGTTMIAVMFGLVVGVIMEPGNGTNLSSLVGVSNTAVEIKKFDLLGFIIDIVPTSLTQAILDGNVIQIVFVAIFVGITINSSNLETTSVKRFFHFFNIIMLRMIAIVIEFSPYAAFALISCVIAEQGLGILKNLSNLILAISIAMSAQYLIFGVLIKFIAKLSPMPFYKKSLEYQAIAFSTSSSKAALGTTMKVCSEKLGISETSTSFILPLGASLNMTGMSINLGIMTIFFAQAFSISLGLHEYAIIILTSTIGTIGGAGIPGASLIMLPMVLASVNIPTEGVIAILAGIDRILDMLRTAVNITGDTTITLLIDASEDTLDRAKYYAP